MEFIKEKNGVYYFILDSGVKHSVEANSKEQAIEKIRNYKEPNEVDILKRKLLRQVKSEVSARLQATDYKVIRHRDQLDLIAKGEVITTTLSAQEYETLLKERNALRIKSNELEAKINNKRSIKTLEKIKIE